MTELKTFADVGALVDTGTLERLRLSRNRVRRKVAAFLTDSAFRAASRLGRMHPLARPERHGLELVADLSYADDHLPEHRLDIYKPVGRPRPWPVVLYVHGGSFRILSKDSHWIMGLAFARAGYMVVSVNYRLAPRHPFPAALEDAARAYAWTVEHAAAFGGDPSRLVLAGESAGANLITALAVATCWQRPEPWTRAVWDTGVVPKAVLPACGILQASDVRRLARRRAESKRPLPAWVVDILAELEDAYLPAGLAGPLDLADPLVVLEEAAAPERPLPAFFASVGTRDPVLPDTKRLAEALTRLGAPVEARYYPREMHAFQALVWTRQARQCWQDTFAFLQRHL